MTCFLSYGSNPEKNFIHLDLKSRFNLTGASECKATVKIPQLGMNYDFTLKHDIDFSDDPKIYLDAHLRKKDVDGKVPVMKLRVLLKFLRRQLQSEVKLQCNLIIEFLSVEGELGSLFYGKIVWVPEGLTTVSFKSEKITVKYSYEDGSSSINIDANVEHPKPQHIKVSGHLDLNKKKQCHLKIMQNDKKKFDLVIDVNKTKTDYTSVTKLVVSDVINLSLVESGDLSMFGRQDCTFEASIKNYDPIRVVHHNEIEQNKAKSTIKYSKNNKEKAVIDVEASLNKEDNKEGYSIKTSIVSPDKSFKDMSLNFKHEISRYGSSAARKTDISFKRDNSDYNAQLSSDFNSNGLEINALMHSPIANFEKQGLSAVLQSSSNNGISSSLSFKTSDDKTISISKLK
ncbi:vitellogenin [Caerostris extrusa]|uniref:Vitellogenin n=1 Tax=Caerostris extrusa TaxID=172846 RepID=A0AAV4W2R6_CAEEX|nr:vitellogenin [Caerostris extrusa]